VKVLHVLGALRPSGAERMLACSYGDWRRGGYQPEIVSMSARPGSFTAELARSGYPIHQLPSSRSLFGLLRYPVLLRRVRPAVVHLHTEQAFLPLAILTRLVAPAAVIVRTVHSTFRWEGRVHGRRQRRVRLSRLVRVRWVACARAVAENELSRYGSRCEVVENWIDVAAMQRVDAEAVLALRRELPLRPDALSVLVVGNCAASKNHELVLEALDQVRRPVDLLHVGVEDEATERERSRWRAVPQRHRLLRLGQRDDVPALLRSCAVVLLPSRREGLSLVAVEALVAGARLIGSDVSGNRWLADEPRVVLLPPAAAAWAAALEAFAAQPVPAPAPAGSGPAPLGDAAAERFSPRRGVRQYLQIYRRAGGQPTAAGSTPG
jgi:glycosyltransferase involved in cell wall biosynthesis